MVVIGMNPTTEIRSRSRPHIRTYVRTTWEEEVVVTVTPLPQMLNSNKWLFVNSPFRILNFCYFLAYKSCDNRIGRLKSKSITLRCQLYNHADSLSFFSIRLYCLGAYPKTISECHCNWFSSIVRLIRLTTNKWGQQANMNKDLSSACNGTTITLARVTTLLGATVGYLK